MDDEDCLSEAAGESGRGEARRGSAGDGFTRGFAVPLSRIRGLPRAVYTCCREWVVVPAFPVGRCGLCGQVPEPADAAYSGQ